MNPEFFVKEFVKIGILNIGIGCGIFFLFQGNHPVHQICHIPNLESTNLDFFFPLWLDLFKTDFRGKIQIDHKIADKNVQLKNKLFGTRDSRLGFLKVS
jgi:hypothetical protein